LKIPDKFRHLAWRDLARARVLETGIFDIYRVEREAADGRRGSFVVIDSPDWVNVVPLLADERGRDCFLMVWQYRQGSRSITLEFPGGLIDPGEQAEQAARRELLEETGYRAGKVSLLGRINPNPAFMSNWCSTYLAEGLEKVAAQELDRNELVDFELVPVEEVERDMGSGIHLHAIMVVALFWYRKWKAGRS
jgi:ADP-ribose pyrophosphatase